MTLQVRYGVTGWEATHAEPFDIALAQEQPDVGDDVDEQWAQFEVEWEPLELDDDDDECAPELLAMHLVEL